MTVPDADLPALHRRASDQFGLLVAQLGPDSWSRPTPCTAWDVRALLAHLVDEALWVPPLLAGETVESVGDRFAGDVLGEDPPAAWSAATAPACDALEEPGAMTRTVHLSFGDVPGAEYARQLIVDLVVHGWDLARGAGLDHRFDPELAAACLAWGEAWRPMLEQATGHFDPPIDAPADADVGTRLVLLFGRRP